MQIVSPLPSEQRPRRIQPLACLPVFFTLTDERVVVIGGSDAACWKAELLAAAGAHVEVYAHQSMRSAELIDLAQRGGSAGSVTLVDCSWRPEHLIGAALAVADLDDGAEAAQFAAASTTAGVPFNVIDRPQFCQFQFGSIVNRSPVVIGISTVGAAPILGQAVRRRIEMLLPRSLAHWGQVARDIRATVMERLTSGPQRRAFWERFAEHTFEADPAQDLDADSMIQAIAGQTSGAGRVTLIEAGRSDADLLTVRAVRALQSADVILFDQEIAESVLDLARREAKRTPVGQQRRSDTVAALVNLAREGRHVVRVRSGLRDGRDGEAAALRHAGIAVTIVPAVTSPETPIIDRSTPRLHLKIAG